MFGRVKLIEICQYSLSFKSVCCLFSFRGIMNIIDVILAHKCRLFLSSTGTTKLANNMGIFQFRTLTIADGGEMTSTSDVKNTSLTLVIGEGKVQGGGKLHLTKMFIRAGNFTVDDLGIVQGDAYDNR